MVAQPIPRIVSGVQSVQAAEEIRKQRQALTAWPYFWSYPPPGSKHVFQSVTIEAPDNGVQSLLVSYQVPDGLRFVFTHIVLNADVGLSWHPGDGNIIWNVDVNRPLNASNAQGIPYKDYGIVSVPLGSFQIPWAIEPGDGSILGSLDTLRIKVTTAAPIAPLSPNFISAAIRGYTCPA